MTTSFALSKDGSRIAFDITGCGPALVLLHGGGQSRRVWHENGYVTRLRDHFTVISVDIRGHGESDKPTSVEDYAIDRLSDDIFAVADAAHVTQFSVWGYSLGGNIVRYLPARSIPVARIVIIGVGFGDAAPPPFRDYALGLLQEWIPVIEAQRVGTLSLDSLSAQDSAMWQSGNMPFTVAYLSAILNWPPVGPTDLACPTLWLVGTANEVAMSSVNQYREQLGHSKVVLRLLPGLTHGDELMKVKEVLPPMLEFTQSP